MVNIVAQNNRLQTSGPTPDQWVKLEAKLSVMGEVSGERTDGSIFKDELKLDVASINFLEYDKTKSHTHLLGGDSIMKIENIASSFSSIPNVDKVIHYNEANVDYFMIVFTEDTDDISFRLASVKVDQMDKYPNYHFEVRYCIEGQDALPKGTVMFSRR